MYVCVKAYLIWCLYIHVFVFFFGFFFLVTRLRMIPFECLPLYIYQWLFLLACVQVAVFFGFFFSFSVICVNCKLCILLPFTPLRRYKRVNERNRKVITHHQKLHFEKCLKKESLFFVIKIWIWYMKWTNLLFGVILGQRSYGVNRGHERLVIWGQQWSFTTVN